MLKIVVYNVLKDEIRGKKLNPIVIGNGKKVVSQSPSSNGRLLPNSNVLLLTEGDLTMPDMTGWTRDDIVAFQSLTDIKIDVKGSGFVKSQSKTPQSAIDKNTKLEVTLDSQKTE